MAIEGQSTFGELPGGTANGVDTVYVPGPAGATGPAGRGIPAGGSIGQVIGKTGVADYETGWTNAGSGDMSKAVYDPTNVNGDAFSMENMTEGATKKILTTTERSKLASTSGTNSGDQNVFSRVSVAGQSDVVADTTSDTLTIEAGANITITTDASTDKVTISATGDMTKAAYDPDDDGIVNSAKALISNVRNNTGATLYKGTIVYVTGGIGGNPTIAKAQANLEATSAGTYGVVFADIPNNSNGKVLTAGRIDTLDTRTTATNPFTSVTLADGDKLYLDPTTAGYVTNVKPAAPNNLVYIGVVTNTSPTSGTIEYHIVNGFELNELHDVSITSIASNDILQYESASSLWKNRSIDGAGIVDKTTNQTVGGVKTFTSSPIVPTPTNPTDAANKNYVDNIAAGLYWKQPVRVATTTNGILATAYANGQTVDGVVLATGDRILIKNQTTATENGIYTVNASGAPTRSADADTGTELINASVFVSEGTTNADTAFVCTNNSTITIGSTNIAFAQFTGGGALTAGNGISITGNSVAINTAVAADLTTAQTFSTGIKTFLAGMFGLRNVANTFTSFFTNTNTASRTYTLKDADGTLAFTSDITGTNSGTNTGDVTLAGAPNYLTIVGQVITRALINLGSHVTGTLPVANGGTGITSLGTGVATALGVNVGTAGSPVVNGGVLGTPSSGTATNLTGLPLTTGVTGTLPVANGGTGVTTSTGSGANVLSTSPNLVTPILGTPTSGNLSNCTADGTNSVGPNGIPVARTFSANFTVALSDNGRLAVHPSSDTTARTITIDSNANLALPSGFAMTIANDTSAGALTIAITADTLVWVPTGGTGSRTLAANGNATIMKISSTRWQISGVGLT